MINVFASSVLDRVFETSIFNMDGEGHHTFNAQDTNLFKQRNFVYQNS